jgi:hypothetical protein
MVLFDCKLIRPVLCSFPTGFLINTQLYLCGAKSAMAREIMIHSRAQTQLLDEMKS